MIVSVDMAVKKDIQKESEIERKVEMGTSEREKISSLLILGRIIKQS